MAVVKKQSYETWYGTAAERAEYISMAPGDKYIETDTGDVYVYTGPYGGWVILSIDGGEF